MAFFSPLVTLAGHVALLLWGMRMVQTGVQRAFGGDLRAILGRALSGRLCAFAAGLGVTALLQSSTATALMATAFAAGGLVELAPALAVMLGANVGTTLIVQILSFNVAAIAPVLVFAGALMFRREAQPRLRDLGRAVIGLGLMLLSLHLILDVMEPLADASALRAALAMLAANPLLAILVAASLAWAAHSSAAVVLLVMSLAAKGALPLDAAFVLALGANLGAAINPLIEASSDDPASRLLPLGNLLNRAFGVALGLAALPFIVRLATAWHIDPARAVADFHTALNAATAALFLPLLDPFARLLRRLLPDRVDPGDRSRPLYLDPAARGTPIVALGGAARESLRLADALEEMLRGARDALTRGDRRLIVETRKLDDVLDRLTTAIKTYLTSIDPDELGESDRRRLDEILAFAMNLEQAGDVIDRNLLPHAAKRIKRGLVFSREGEAELMTLMDRLIANLRVAASLFMTEDERAARLLADEKVAFRAAERDGRAGHFTRLREGRLEAAETSALHLDLLRDMKLVNSHIVAAAAYPVLERSGGLLESRIAEAS